MGEGAETVDERLWGDDDKREEDGGPEEQRGNAPVQACPPPRVLLCTEHAFCHSYLDTGSSRKGP